MFSSRVARFPGAWVLLHRLLSAPLLLRLRQRSLAVDGVRVTCRVRSDQLAWLLDGASLVEDVTSSGPPDVEVVRIHPWAARSWRRRGWQIVPSFVLYRGPVAGVPPARRSKSLRANLSRARRSGFGARRGGGARDWARAREMVESWGRVRFGADVWLPPEHAWRRLRRRGSLLMIGNGARDVAMAVVVPGRGGREAWFASLGVADGDAALMRDGALTASYAAVAEHARAIGAEVLNAGRCTPRADDPRGVYKSRWGLRPSHDPLSPLYAVRAVTPRGERFLEGRRLLTPSRRIEGENSAAHETRAYGLALWGARWRRPAWRWRSPAASPSTIWRW